jgi:hypothetical protein
MAVAGSIEIDRPQAGRKGQAVAMRFSTEINARRPTAELHSAPIDDLGGEKVRFGADSAPRRPTDERRECADSVEEVRF